MMDPILKIVQNSVTRLGMAPEGSLILAAHSGGPDSTAMLHILVRLAPALGIRVESIHFDHGLRPESGQDAQFAAQTAAELGMDFHTQRDPSPPQRRIQESARQARYDFFEKVARQRGAARVATGHTLDDSVETSIMWMLRGAGPTAFGGLPAARGIFIRPLISLRKGQILDWLANQGIDFITDRSNLTDKYQRNRIRRHIIPAMEKEAPAAVAAIARLANLCGELGRAMEQMAENILASSTRDEAVGSVTLDPAFTASAPMALRGLVYKAAARRLGVDPSALTERHVNALDAIILSGKLGRWADLPGGLKVVADHAGVTFTTRSAAPADEEIPFRFPLNASFGEGIIDVAPGVTAGQEAALISVEKVPSGAVFRRRKPGDYLIPMNFLGRKKLKKFLIDRKVPSSRRDMTPLLAIGAQALWIPGLFLAPTILAGPQDAHPATLIWHEASKRPE